MRLGKQDYKFDEKTLNLGSAFSPSIVVPHSFDLDAHRHAFPLQPWGNLQWGNCVKAAQVNEILRLERIEQRKTIAITDEDVVNAYKAQTGAQSPGDANDNGLVMLENNRLWRKEGFSLKSRTYKVAAFGELEPSDHQQLRAAIFLLHGVQFGYALPKSAQDQMNDPPKHKGMKVWDVIAGNGVRTKPGSWGGHAVYSKAYDDDGVEVLTWGEKVFITNAFIDRYCDEEWAVVDDFDTWRKRPEIDINGVIQHLRDIGASGIE